MSAQWTCPHCLDVLPSRDDMKKHLEPDKQLISYLLDRLREALTLPSCQQPQVTSDSENEENDDFGGDSDPTKFSLVKEDLRCPRLNCGKAYTRKQHLVRHFKTHVACKTSCECGLKFDNVDHFDKHLACCQILKAESGSPARYNKERSQILGIQRELSLVTKKRLNELLKNKTLQERELPSSSGTCQAVQERNQTSPTDNKERADSSRGIKRRRSDQGDLGVEDVLSPQSPCNAIGQQLFDFLPSYNSNIADVDDGTNTIQTFGSPMSYLRAQQSADDITLAEKATFVSVDGSVNGVQSDDFMSQQYDETTFNTWTREFWNGLNAFDGNKNRIGLDDSLLMHPQQHDRAVFNTGARVFWGDLNARGRIQCNDIMSMYSQQYG